LQDKNKRRQGALTVLRTGCSSLGIAVPPKIEPDVGRPTLAVTFSPLRRGIRKYSEIRRNRRSAAALIGGRP